MGVPISCEVASAVVLEDGTKVPRMLMLKWAKAHFEHEWCHVAGGIEAGETTWRAALREIAEETASNLDNNARLDKPTSILASAIEMQVSRPLTLMHQALDAAAACPDRVHHSRAERTLS